MLKRRPKLYFPTPKPKREIQFPFWLFKFLFFLGFLFALFYLLFYSPYFLIKNIKISGTTNEEILNLTSSLKGKNLWLFNKKRLKEILLGYAEIESVSIIRWPPKTVKIKIKESSQGIIWQTQGKRYLLSSSGQVLKEVTQSSLPEVLDTKNLPVEIKKQIVAPSFIIFIKDLVLKFPQKTGLPIKEIRIFETTFYISVLTEHQKGPFSVIFDTQGDLDTQIDYFKRVYELKKDEIKEKVDLTIWDTGKVIYK